jgi:deferrochelatase/peroxidase EfeB
MSQKNTSMDASRRRFFKAAATAGAAAAGSMGLCPMAVLAQTAPAAASRGDQCEPFYGLHQSGILTPQQSHSVFAAFDLDTNERQAVIALLQRWTHVAARLSRGETADVLGQNPDAVPGDGGSALGLPGARLTMTFGFGPGLFMRDGIDRYGLAKRRPQALVDLPRFNGDQLDAARCGGDLSVQACADDPQVAFHAIRELASLAEGSASLKWLQTGFASAPVNGGTGRNLMGFKDGTNNPPKQPEVMNQVVWVGPEGGWMQNGSYLVVRRIRISLEHWDKTPLGFQEEVVGRHKASGAPLGKQHEFDSLDLAATDADGTLLIPANAHARLASAASNDGARILRRAYSFNDGAGFRSERWPPWRQGIFYDAGLFFMAYQRDPRTGFIRINQKLAREDIMNQFTTHVGSAIFACPPGVSPGSYLGAGLFES